MLYQLPPGWKLDLDRFEHFLRALPTGYRHTVEFREPSWYDERVYALMRQYRVALCLHDMPGSATERLAVTRLAMPPGSAIACRYGSPRAEPPNAPRDL